MNAPAFTLSATCLDAQGGGALCLHADWPHEGLVLKGQALPLTLVHPWLPKKMAAQSTCEVYSHSMVTCDRMAMPGKVASARPPWKEAFA